MPPNTYEVRSSFPPLSFVVFHFLPRSRVEGASGEYIAKQTQEKSQVDSPDSVVGQSAALAVNEYLKIPIIRRGKR